jgi:hypothetical protein
MKNKYTINFALWIIIFFCLNGSRTEAQALYLSDIPHGFIANEFGPPNKDMSFEKNPITIGGKTYQKGIGVHAPSLLYIDLEGKASKFQAEIGIDGEVTQKPERIATRDSTELRNAFSINSPLRTPMVRFIIRGDDLILYSSGWITESSPAISIDVDVSSVDRLSLIVENGPDGPRDGHADWASAQLILKDNSAGSAFKIYYYPSELLLNQTGFIPASSKTFRIPDYTVGQNFSVLDLSNMQEVYSGKIQEKSGDWGKVGIGDFSSVIDPGQYFILVGDQVSLPFTIHSLQYIKNLDQHLNWFLMQRCGDPENGWEKGQHLDDGRRLDNDEHQDVSGGWHDAADLRKWGMTINGLWALSEIYLTFSSNEVSDFIGKSNMLFQIRDEITWGNKYFRAMQEPDGYLMDQIGGDVYEHGDNNRFTDNIPGTPDDRWIVTTPNAPVFQYMFVIAQCNIALAEKSEPDNPYIQAAERCYRWVYNNRVIMNIHELGAALTASLKLNAATGKSEYMEMAELYLERLLQCQNTIHKPMNGFMGSVNPTSGISEKVYSITNLSYQLITPNFPIWAIVESIRYIKDPSLSEKAKNAFRRYVDNFIAYFDQKSTYGIVPMALYFGDPGGSRQAGDYYYRWCYVNHENSEWWNGINPRIGYVGACLVRGGMLINHPQAIRIGQQQLDFIYGCNPFNASTVTGLGYNQPEFFKTSEFVPHTPKIDGAVMAGIGSSEEDMPVLLPEWWQTTEYWMEAVGGTIMLLNELNRYQYQSEKNLR